MAPRLELFCLLVFLMMRGMNTAATAAKAPKCHKSEKVLTLKSEIESPAGTTDGAGKASSVDCTGTTTCFKLHNKDAGHVKLGFGCGNCTEDAATKLKKLDTTLTCEICPTAADACNGPEKPFTIFKQKASDLKANSEACKFYSGKPDDGYEKKVSVIFCIKGKDEDKDKVCAYGAWWTEDKTPAKHVYIGCKKECDKRVGKNDDNTKATCSTCQADKCPAGSKTAVDKLKKSSGGANTGGDSKTGTTTSRTATTKKKDGDMHTSSIWTIVLAVAFAAALR
jgi:hypothetical protein